MAIELKATLVVLIAVSFVSASAFAEASIEIDASPKSIKSLETIVITGTITGVADYKPVKITVKGPNGEIVYAPLVTIGGDGEFRRVLQPTIPSFEAGTYTVIASHEDTTVTTLTQFTVTAQEIPRGMVEPPTKGDTSTNNLLDTSSKISMSADAINGSDIITITGNTSVRGTDITLIASSPGGNVVTIAQVSPDSSGNFEAEIKVGGPMWKEDGVYMITANQGTVSEHKATIEVDIEDGLVVPEFGVIASLILAMSLIAIILFSTKTKLSILPRY